MTEPSGAELLPFSEGEPALAMAQRLERGEVVFFPRAPFPLPTGEDHAFLLQQQLGGAVHKNISYDPATGRAGGFARSSSVDADRLRELFASFSQTTTDWLSRTLPQYSAGWQLDRISYRPEEEATRRLRHLARNDLLHVDAFPGRPSQGRRILRVFANVNPTEPRIWVTSSPFAALLEQYGEAAGLPGRNGADWLGHLREGVVRLFRPGQAPRSAYDSFMLCFHDYLKQNEEFQERGPKRLWTFPPGSAWVAVTDTCSHSVLRGRYALEHSYFVAPHVLALPDESPPVLLTKACLRQVARKAA
jgi:3-deoxy-D-manno-oct-2-ulosonic acid (Kdo) hydroxylase